jgi:hypothetical protein
MYQDFFVPFESGESVLVTLEFWRDGEWAREACIRSFGNRYFFEGRTRELRRWGTHRYFPNPECQMIGVGNKTECTDFLNYVLPLFGCPLDILASLLRTVNEWNERS